MIDEEFVDDDDVDLGLGYGTDAVLSEDKPSNDAKSKSQLAEPLFLDEDEDGNLYF
jgi:hypothetical protein